MPAIGILGGERPMLAAIKHGLGNLFNFQGRDARQAF
jgi:hypothetical protein